MATIPLFPLSNALFPAGVLHLRIFEVRYLDMIRRCIADGSEFGVVALLSGNEVRSPEGQEVLADTGTLARIDAWDAPMPALLQLRCVGTSRFRLVSSQLAKYGLWMGEIQPIPDDPPLPVPARCNPAPTPWAAWWPNGSRKACPPTACRWRRHTGWMNAPGWLTAGANCCRCRRRTRSGCWR